MTDVYLAHLPAVEPIYRALCREYADGRPNLLVSYFHISEWENRQRQQVRIGKWVLDSGAFTAKNQGTTIDHDAFIEKALELRQCDPLLGDVFGLDVIGDARASVRNVEIAWERGLECIPTFHFGSPWPMLEHIAKTYPKIALGGMVGRSVKLREEFVKECFARVWPKKIHGLGMTVEATLMRYPFHSVDSSTWSLSPARYGEWRSLGGTGWRQPRARLRTKGTGSPDVSGEVRWYLKFEKRLKQQWAKEMALLETL